MCGSEPHGEAEWMRHIVDHTNAAGDAMADIQTLGGLTPPYRCHVEISK
jgi:hypothetical protein